jgi:hypothetical protein
VADRDRDPPDRPRQEAANELAKLYAAAVRMILLQKPASAGSPPPIEWEGEQYTDAPADFTQIGAIGAGRLQRPHCAGL